MPTCLRRTSAVFSLALAQMTLAQAADMGGAWMRDDGNARVESRASSISQSEIPRNVKNFEDFMEGAMRRQPTDIIIGECPKPEHMIATMQAAISGPATATTIHAETVPLTMQRVASLLPPVQLKDAMTSCSQALRLVIN